MTYFRTSLWNLVPKFLFILLLLGCNKDSLTKKNSGVLGQFSSRSNAFNNYENVEYDADLQMLVFKDSLALSIVVNQLRNDIENFFFDKGNTTEILNLISNHQPPGHYKAELIVASPLSDTVLNALLSSGMPHGIIKEVFLVNIPLTDEIETKLQMSSLPSGIKSEILTAASNVIVIENPVLAAFERLFIGYVSMRAQLESEEKLFLQSGQDPESTNNPDNHFIQNEVLRTVFNSNGEIRIGSDIVIILEDGTDVKIKNHDLSLLNSIRNSGNIPINLPLPNEPKNGFPYNLAPLIISFNLVIDAPSTTSPSPTLLTCLADFSFTGGGLNTLNFIDNSIGGAFTYYYWDFGDGNVSYQQNPTHTYSNTGTYIVTLQVVESSTNYCHTQQKVTIGSCAVNFSYSQSDMQFSFTSSLVDVIPPVSYTWNFGDGSPLSSQANPSHLYGSAGAKTVCLTIRDAVGCTATVCKTIYPKEPVCCDKNDRDRDQWILYASNSRKFRCIIYTYNIFGIHTFGAKTKNYKYNNTLNIWVWKKADIIFNHYVGNIYTEAANCASGSECGFPNFVNMFRSKEDAWIVDNDNSFNCKIWLRKNSFCSTYGVKYNGNQIDSGLAGNFCITDKDCD